MMFVPTTANQSNALIVHPLDTPSISAKMHAYQELVAKIRKMEPILIYCVSTENDSGSGFGASTYSRNFYTSEEEAKSKNTGFNSNCFVMPVVRDEFKDIYEVTFEKELELTKLTVQRHFQEQLSYESAQKSKQKSIETERLLLLIEDAQKKLKQLS